MTPVDWLPTAGAGSPGQAADLGIILEWLHGA